MLSAGDGLLIPIVTILDREIAVGVYINFADGPLMNLTVETAKRLEARDASCCIRRLLILRPETFDRPCDALPLRGN